MSLKEFFKPTKRKIVISFIIPIIWVLVLAVIAFAYYSYSQYDMSKNPNTITAQLKSTSIIFHPELVPYWIFSMFIGMIISTVYHYPLGCYISELMEIRKKKKIVNIFSIKRASVLILLILVFNPISFKVVQSLIYYETYYPCGVEIVNFTEISPARSAGLAIGDVIQSVDESKINTSASLAYILSSKKPGDSILIETKTNKYNLVLSENPQTHKAFMGILQKNKVCSKW